MKRYYTFRPLTSLHDQRSNLSFSCFLASLTSSLFNLLPFPQLQQTLIVESLLCLTCSLLHILLLSASPLVHDVKLPLPIQVPDYPNQVPPQDKDIAMCLMFLNLKPNQDCSPPSTQISMALAPLCHQGYLSPQ